MKITVGTDIIEVDRIKKALGDDRFKKEVFTDEEIKYCESKGNSKYQHYAARFAAKEAVFKAISKYLNDKYEISWKNAEVLNDNKGRPYVNLIDVNVNYKDIDISLSHLKDLAIANVAIEVEE